MIQNPNANLTSPGRTSARRDHPQEFAVWDKTPTAMPWMP